MFSDMIHTYENFNNKQLLINLNRHKNIISRSVHIMVTHDMVLKTRFRANIQYWIHRFRYMIFVK